MSNKNTMLFTGLFCNISAYIITACAYWTSSYMLVIAAILIGTGFYCNIVAARCKTKKVHHRSNAVSFCEEMHRQFMAEPHKTRVITMENGYKAIGRGKSEFQKYAKELPYK